MKRVAFAITASLLITTPVNCFLWYQLGHSYGWTAGLEICKR